MRAAVTKAANFPKLRHRCSVRSFGRSFGRPFVRPFRSFFLHSSSILPIVDVIVELLLLLLVTKGRRDGELERGRGGGRARSLVSVIPSSVGYRSVAKSPYYLPQNHYSSMKESP